MTQASPKMVGLADAGEYVYRDGKIVKMRQYYISYNDLHKRCHICNEEFPVVWENSSSEWMLGDAIRVKIEHKPESEIDDFNSADNPYEGQALPKRIFNDVAMHMECYEAIKAQEIPTEQPKEQKEEPKTKKTVENELPKEEPETTKEKSEGLKKPTSTVAAEEPLSPEESDEKGKESVGQSTVRPPEAGNSLPQKELLAAENAVENPTTAN